MGVVSKKRARSMFVAAAMHATLPAARQRKRYYIISIITPRPGGRDIYHNAEARGRAGRCRPSLTIEVHSYDRRHKHQS